MTNVSEGDSPLLHIVLERIDAVRNVARYYVLSIEPTLFAKHTLIRRWGRIGSAGRERLQFFGGEDAARAQMALEDVARPKAQARLCAEERPGLPCPSLQRRRLRLNPLVHNLGLPLAFDSISGDSAPR